MSRDPDRRERARRLRHELTPAERILWKNLRNRLFAGFKFRRQHPIGRFIADMACRECKLILEVDGETHLGQETRDEKRTNYLQSHDWLVLRFWNTEVYDELESVLEAIYRVCIERLAKKAPPHPQPLSPEDGGEGSKTRGTLSPGTCVRMPEARTRSPERSS